MFNDKVFLSQFSDISMERDLVLKYSLINAVEHNGKAELQAVLGRILAEKPSLKPKIKELIQEISRLNIKLNAIVSDSAPAYAAAR